MFFSNLLARGCRTRVAGGFHAAYSMLTDYPLGIVRAIPFKAHLGLDAVEALALATAPFITGQFHKGKRAWLPQVGLAAFELASLLMTDPSGGGDFHGDVEAVRRANSVSPQRKIYEGPRAVNVAA